MSISVIVSEITRKKDAQGRPDHWDDSSCSGFHNPWPSWRSNGFKDMVYVQKLMSQFRKFPAVSKEASRLIPIRKPNWGAVEAAERSHKDNIKSTWLGHACFLVEMPSRSEFGDRGARILFDPVFSDRCSPSQWIGPKRFTQPPCKIEEIPEVDAVVISHNHYDHLDTQTIQVLSKRPHIPHFFAPLGNGSYFQSFSIPDDHVHIMDWWDTKRVEVSIPTTRDKTTHKVTVDISCTPAQHFTGRSLWDRFKTLWASWVVEEVRPQGSEPGMKVFFGGDTGYRAVPDGKNEDEMPVCPVFKEIGERFDSVRLFKDIRAKKALGMHWGTWVLTTEDVSEPPKRLAEECKKVFRNVKDFGAKGDGVTDDTHAINPIIALYLTQLIGDAKTPPTLLASSNFEGMAVIGTSFNPHPSPCRNQRQQSNPQTVGALAIIDAVVTNTPIFVRSSQPSAGHLAGSLVIANARLNNVQTAVGVVGGATVLPGGSRTIEAWGQGNVYKGANGNGGFVQGDVVDPAIPQVLLGGGGKVFGRVHPQYEGYAVSDFVSVRDQGAKGDGRTDDTAALKAVFAKYAGCKIIFFDAGTYVVTSTLTIPAGARVVGEAWSVIAGSGKKFQDQANPQVVVRVGEPGSQGVLEISDMIFSTIGPAPGAIVVEWNVKQPAGVQGGAGAWDTHIRLGGAAGTNLEVEQCPSSGAGGVDRCYAAFLALHIKPGATAYLEGLWAWLADHDLDGDGTSQISIYSGRGILSESAGPVWMIGTGAQL
ncbi:hypothetical protein C0993_000803 [Termitomyces sp. T159_Od127]|nr:hypothetical protein C0993_000803 [Termitomyces sp. T159_Od127]